MPEPVSPALKAVSDAVLAVASQLSVDEVLQRLVDCARELAGARYAALGIPDGAGGFRRFLVAGMSDELIAAMGPLPRTHGMLGAMLERRGAYLTDDIHHDPRFRGWWPRRASGHALVPGRPDPRPRRGDRRLLPDREGGRGDASTSYDQELIELLAAHAAIAITNARLYERSRELSILSERNRLALELHDVVSQKLFSLNLDAPKRPPRCSTATRRGRGPSSTAFASSPREALAELRSLILGLRPADLERDGLEGALRKEARCSSACTGSRSRSTPTRAADRRATRASASEILRIAEEALHNAVRHAARQHVTVRLRRRWRDAPRRGRRRRHRL